MKPKILKSTASHEYVAPVKPARLYVPEWYKKASRYLNGATKPSLFNEKNNALKQCVPLLDALTTGYIAELWADLEVRQTTQGPDFAWSEGPDVLNGRKEDPSNTVPVPVGHGDLNLVWLTPYIFKTPPGYSLLITHPLNRFDLPFTTLSGVVDADDLMMDGKLPFYLQKDFEGIIPAGTPLFQVIPFKRDDWKVVEDVSLREKAKKYQWLSNRVAYGFYKKNLWSKKTYN